jgi:hypothetical protein
VVLARADRHQIAQPVEVETRVHALAARREVVDRAGPSLLRRRLGSVIEPAPQFGGQQPRALVVGDVGPTATGRQPVEVHEMRAAVRKRVGELHQDAAALRVADERDRPAGGGVENRERVADIGVPVVEHGVIRVAVTPLIPTHDAPAGRGEQRGEHIERPREVEATMGQEQWWRIGVAPLPHGQSGAAFAHPPLAIGTTGAENIHRDAAK